MKTPEQLWEGGQVAEAFNAAITERDRWRTVAEELASAEMGWDVQAMKLAMSAFEQAKRDFDDPHLPTFTSAKINPESKP